MSSLQWIDKQFNFQNLLSVGPLNLLKSEFNQYKGQCRKYVVI